MSAINESLWFGFTDTGGANPTFSVWRYDIYDGELTEVWAWTPGGLLGTHWASMCWDGGYYIWVCMTDTLNENYAYERFRITDYVAEAFTEASEDLLTHSFTQDWGSRIVTTHQPSSGARLWNYSFATKQWGAFPTETYTFGQSSTPVTIPPWATNKAGNVLVIGDSGDTTRCQLYDYSTGWSTTGSLNNAKSGGKSACWTDYGGNEYIYCIVSSTKFERYDCSAGTWTDLSGSITPPASTHNQIYSGSNMVWDGDQYLFYTSEQDQVIYRFDLNAQSWDSYVNSPVGFDTACCAYTPRIRFVFLDSDSDPIYNPTSLGSVPKNDTSDGVKYYLKALEAEGGTVTIGKLTDARTDADDVLQLAPDSGGSPGTWANSVSMGSFSADESKPFWMRTNTLSTTGQEAKVARLKLTLS